jgi:hypothetical protein
VSHYIAGGLMILLLIGVAVLGLEAFGVYDAARMVDAALLDGQLALATDGGVSPTVRELVRERIVAEGGNPSRLTVEGSWPHTAYGEIVTLQVVYAYPYTLHAPLLGGTTLGGGIFRVRRTARTLSGYQP